MTAGEPAEGATDGEIPAYQFYPAVICSQARLTLRQSLVRPATWAPR